MEAVLKNCSVVENVCIYGDSKRYIVNFNFLVREKWLFVSFPKLKRNGYKSQFLPFLGAMWLP